MNVFLAEGIVLLVIQLAVLALTIYAFVNALTFSAQSYVAADKLTKKGWLTILGIALALQFVLPGQLFILRVALFIAVVVYLVDVKPALSGLYRR